MEFIKNLLSGISLQPETIPNWLVVVMGIGTVFVGLIAIIIICKITSLFFVKRKEEKVPETASAPVAQKSAVIENRQEIIAAVCAACAEDMGTDISALRVVSFKKI
jgi:sodium pump decarboxylase gamma subunit